MDTIFEIGGQDSKFISIENGVVVDFAMNEACAAGTGSFLEEQAEKLGVNIKGEFAKLALHSASPTRLGERCTVFMERDVTGWLHKGETVPLDSPPAVRAPVTAFIDGSPVEVSRATLAPGYVGYYLVELQIPAIVNRGTSELRIVVNGEESPGAVVSGVGPGGSVAESRGCCVGGAANRYNPISPLRHSANTMKVEIEGVTLHLAHPDELPVRWVGQEELMRQLLAAWMVVTDADIPMSPRLIGKPGVGKTTLAYAAAKPHGPGRLHHAGDARYAPRRSAGDAGDRRRRTAALCRFAAGERHDPRRHRHSRRRQPHERKELGQPRAAAR